MQIRIADLCCGPGGSAVGYAQAAAELGVTVRIVGVDIEPQPHYPFEFVRSDVLEFPLDGFDFAHGSPPCQDYSPGNHWLRPGQKRIEHARLIIPMRQRLLSSGIPWIIENVRMALPDMLNPVMLCGTSLGLRVQRHRLFDSSALLFAAGSCRHRPYDISVRSHRTEYLGAYVEATTKRGKVVRRPQYCPVTEASGAMGIDWMTQEELGQAIPPAYTRWLGLQMFAAILAERAA